MGEWKEYKLGEIAQVMDSKRVPLSSNERKLRQGKHPYYGASGIIDYIDDFIFEGEYVLISEDGENLRTRQTPIAFIANGKFWVNNHAHIIKSDQIHNRLICYWFAYIDINPYLTGAVQPKLNQSALNSIPLHLPKSNEKRRSIVNILSSLDDKIDLLNRQNTTLEAMAETLFRQWFIENPKEEWKEGVIANIAIHSKTAIHPQKQPTELFYHYSIPSFDNAKTPTMDLGSNVQSNKYKVFNNSILFSKLNPHKDKRVWLLLNNVLNNSICSTEFQIINPINKDYLYFIYGWLTYSDNYNDIASGVGGTSGSHQRIDPATIFSTACPIIDIDYIRLYNTQAKPLFEKQINNREQIRGLIRLRDTLLPKLMNNEIKL